MAATNTYVDQSGDRRWKQSAVCPALGGNKTCGRHLKDGRRFRKEVSSIRREVKSKKLQGQLIAKFRPVGCPGDLYPQLTADEPAECPTFHCGTCGKNVPWSCGCGDEYGDDCDECAVKKMKRDGEL